MNTGNNLLFIVVSALLAFMTVTGILGRRNLESVGLTVLAPDEIYDGAGTMLTLRLKNRGRLMPLFLIRVRLLDGTARFAVVEGGGERTLPLAVFFQGRGRHVLPRAEVSSPFPVNFFVRFRNLPLEQEIVVFPALRPCPAPGGGETRREAGIRQTGPRGYEGEMQKISAYTGAEPLKLVHWKLSARTGELKVKEFTSPESSPVIIDPADLPGGPEERLSCAAWLVNRLMQENRPVGLKTPRGVVPPQFSPSHRLRLLRELALYEQ